MVAVALPSLWQYAVEQVLLPEAYDSEGLLPPLTAGMGTTSLPALPLICVVLAETMLVSFCVVFQ
jgi:hypothetical protein